MTKTHDRRLSSNGNKIEFTGILNPASSTVEETSYTPNDFDHVELIIFSEGASVDDNNDIIKAWDEDDEWTNRARLFTGNWNSGTV